MFHLLLDRHRERLQHQELLAGIIACQVTNHSMNPAEKVLAPKDFMPSLFAPKPKRQRVTQRDRDMAVESIRAFFNAPAKP